MDRRAFLKKAVAATRVAGITPIAGAGVLDAVPNTALAKSLKTKTMKIVVLTGSPRRNGNTNYLAEQFIAGAKENGHEVFRFDCAEHEVAGCMACNHCGTNGNCVLKDDFGIIRPHLIDANMVVFVTPMYYFGFSAQLKSVVDRFYAINDRIKGAAKKTALLMAYADTAEKEAEAMLLHYRTLARYLGWEDCGTVVAPGVWTAGSVKNTRYGNDAYRLGKRIEAIEKL